MDTELCLAVELFIELATFMREEPRPPMGDSFEEWLFWRTPAAKRYRSARQGVARVEVPSDQRCFDLILWQSLLEHPDLVLEREEAQLGVECKSLAASAGFIETGSGVPCRTTIDFNSTVPCGQEHYKGKFRHYAALKGQPLRTFYALALYGEIEDESHVLSFLLVDGNYINRDYGLHQEHRNISRGGFGSYGDGRIRERKMYIFPNPLTDEDLVSSMSLIAEAGDLVADFPQLSCVMTKVRRTPVGMEYLFYVYQLA
jgi:hypothetical protein